MTWCHTMGIMKKRQEGDTKCGLWLAPGYFLISFSALFSMQVFGSFPIWTSMPLILSTLPSLLSELLTTIFWLCCLGSWFWNPSLFTSVVPKHPVIRWWTDSLVSFLICVSIQGDECLLMPHSSILNPPFKLFFYSFAFYHGRTMAAEDLKFMTMMHMRLVGDM